MDNLFTAMGHWWNWAFNWFTRIEKSMISITNPDKSKRFLLKLLLLILGKTRTRSIKPKQSPDVLMIRTWTWRLIPMIIGMSKIFKGSNHWKVPMVKPFLDGKNFNSKLKKSLVEGALAKWSKPLTIKPIAVLPSKVKQILLHGPTPYLQS